MSSYYESATIYDKMQEDGRVKKVTERFIVDALSVSECEARTIEERQPFISGDFPTVSVKKTKIAEAFFGDEDKWYLAKVATITIDEKTAAEKRTITQILVNGSDFENAYARLREGMRGTLADWELTSLAETPYLDVYKPKPMTTTIEA